MSYHIKLDGPLEKLPQNSQTSNISVKNSNLVFYVNDENITVPVQVDDGKEHTAYVEKLGQTIRFGHQSSLHVSKTNNENIFSMKVDDVRAAGTGGKLDTGTLKQSDLYLGIKFGRHHLYISPYGGLMPMIVSK